MTTVGAALVKHGVVIAPGSAGSWNEAIVESPAIFWDASIGKYRMVFTGYNAGPTAAAIGCATSANLIGPWDQSADNPILAGSGSGADSAGCTGPLVWYENGTYHLFYIGLTATGYEGGAKSLCLATSTDFSTWTRHGAVISPSGSGWRAAAIWHPSIVKRGSTYYLFFNATGTSETIGYATSMDLLAWTVDDVNSPLISAGTGWESANVGDPSVYLVGSTWWMAYYGFNGTNAYDGLASTSDANFPLGWTKYASNPVLSPSAGIDALYAHKPFIIDDGNVYWHWYTAVSLANVRQIALATQVLASESDYPAGWITAGNAPAYGSGSALTLAGALYLAKREEFAIRPPSTGLV